MKNTKRPKSKDKLTLKRETIRKLTDRELRAVVGGACTSLCGEGGRLTSIIRV